jgi:hypothetical protein
MTLRWAAPGPYAVAFTTREGGVSTGPYASLNLALRSGDDPAAVAENRRLACAELGLDADRMALNRQRHSAIVLEARDGMRDAFGDGLWSAEPGLPMLALSADCVPIAIARADGTPALAVVHAGWRGLVAGVVAAAVEALGPGVTAAAVGPAVGPCCYEIGPEVAAQFDDSLVSGSILDLWSAAEQALRAAGVATVERTDICTRCNPDLFFSHRRSGELRGTQGVLGAVIG